MKLLALTPTALIATFLPLSSTTTAAPDNSKRSYGQIILWTDSYYSGFSQWSQIIGTGTSITACRPAYSFMNDQVSFY
jgi:hypothetical protein